jgi:predicted DNA-binding transcriptional regulator YafY
VLRLGPDVEVISPEDLRQRVVKRLTETVRQYRATGSGFEPVIG